MTTGELIKPVSPILTNWAPEGGFHLGAEECPWIPADPGAWNKFMLFDLRKNSFVTLFKIDPGRALPPHYHTMAVVGYVLEGTWKYDEYEWVASPGSFVYEPPGQIHTLRNIGDVPMVSVFHVTGPEVTVDEQHRLIRYMDARTMLEFTRDFCESTGFDGSFIARITR